MNCIAAAFALLLGIIIVHAADAEQANSPQGKGAVAKWKASDRCARQAQAAFPSHPRRTENASIAGAAIHADPPCVAIEPIHFGDLAACSEGVIVHGPTATATFPFRHSISTKPPASCCHTKIGLTVTEEVAGTLGLFNEPPPLEVKGCLNPLAWQASRLLI